MSVRTLTAKIEQPGYALGPAQNVFADAPTRDSYAVANDNWLSMYNSKRSNYIRVGATIQRRNTAGDDWEDVSEPSVVSGASITATLVSPRDIPIANRINDAVVLPFAVTAVADASGEATLQLAATKDYEYDSRYRISIKVDNRETQRFLIRMPDADSNLHDLEFVQ